jgi:hypothetical protein
VQGQAVCGTNVGHEPAKRAGLVPPAHLQEVLQNRLLSDLLHGQGKGAVFSKGCGGPVPNRRPTATVQTVMRQLALTTEFQCSATARAMSSLLLVGCTPCTSYCLVYLRSVWTSTMKDGKRTADDQQAPLRVPQSRKVQTACSGTARGQQQ